MRIEDYNWRGLPPDLVEWLTDVTDLLNTGRYQFRLGSVPTASTAGNEGEHIMAKDGSTWYLYIYTDSTDKWKRLAMANLS